MKKTLTRAVTGISEKKERGSPGTNPEPTRLKILQLVRNVPTISRLCPGAKKKGRNPVRICPQGKGNPCGRGRLLQKKKKRDHHQPKTLPNRLNRQRKEELKRGKEHCPTLLKCQLQSAYQRGGATQEDRVRQCQSGSGREAGK